MKKILNFIVHSNAAGALAAVALVCMYAVACNGYQPNAERSIQIMETVEWRDYLSLVGCILMGYLSVKPSVEYALSNIHTQLPAVLFLMGCTIVPLQVCTPRNLAVLSLLATGCYMLLRTYRNCRASGSYFTAYVLVGLSTLIEPQLLWTAPLLLLCCIPLRSLCVRTIVAGVMGLLCTYWVTFGLLYVTDHMVVGYDLLARLTHCDWDSHPYPRTMNNLLALLSPLLWMLLLTIPSSAAILKDNTLNLRSRTCYYYCIAVLGTMLLLCMVLPMLYATLLPLCLLLAAYVGIPLYTEANTRGKCVYALAVLLVWTILITHQLWIRYIPS